MNIQRLNELDPIEAEALFQRFCGSKAFCKLLATYRPFESVADVHTKADLAMNVLTDADWLEAFACHPKIGESKSVKMATPGNRQWSSHEQQGMQESDDSIRARIAELNKVYEAKFGYIYIVSASGKSAIELLRLLEERLNNAPKIELSNAAAEQRKITHLRLGKLEIRKMITISTHVLNTALGSPASGVNIHFERAGDQDIVELASGTTNSDGRVIDLSKGLDLRAGEYRLRFETRAYFNSIGCQEYFYPEITIMLQISNDGHYHIPLLLAPFGYSTYRGS